MAVTTPDHIPTNCCIITAEDIEGCTTHRDLLINKGVPVDDETYIFYMERVFYGYVIKWERLH